MSASPNLFAISAPGKRDPPQEHALPRCFSFGSFPQPVVPAWLRDMPSVRLPSSPRSRTKRLVKANEHMLRRIRLVLSQFSVPAPPQSQSAVRSPTQPGSLVLQVKAAESSGRKRGGHKSRTITPSSDPRPGTAEELRRSLAELSHEILVQLPVCSLQIPGDYRVVITLLEKYKRRAGKWLAMALRGDGGYDRLFAALAELRRKAEQEGAEVPLHFECSRKRKRHRGGDSKEQVLKAYVKSLGGADSVWLQLAPYFQPLSAEVESAAQCAAVSLSRPQEDDMLNLHAINRLAAIAKMQQYCFDRHMTPEQFRDGRTTQKLRAFLQQHKHLSESKGARRRSTFAPEKEAAWFYPSQEELEYLLALGTTELTQTVTQLLAMVSSPMRECSVANEIGRVEAELKLVGGVVRERYAQVFACEKVQTATEDRGTKGEDRIIRQYFSEIVPKTVKKHNEKLAAENRQVDSNSAPASAGKSNTGKRWCAARRTDEGSIFSISVVGSESRDDGSACCSNISSMGKSEPRGSSQWYSDSSSFLSSALRPRDSSSLSGSSSNVGGIQHENAESSEVDDSSSAYFAVPQGDGKFLQQAN